MKHTINSFLKKFLETKYILLLLVVITLAYYGQSLSFDFLTFDDDMFITKNEVVASDDSSLIDCFKYKLGEHDYFPLTFVFFRILKNLFGFNPLYFHAFNLLLHSINVILVFFLSFKILKKLNPGIIYPGLWSGLIALLFSIHPIHVESVAWAIDLKDILYSLFYLLGMITYWKWLEKRGAKFYLLTILFAFLSLLSKSTAITFVAILFFIDWLNGEKLNQRLLLSKIPFLFLTFLGFYVFGLFTNPSATLVGITGETGMNLTPYFPDYVAGLPVVIQRIIIASFRLLFWIFHSMFPLELNLFYIRRLMLEKYALLLPALPFILVSLMLAAWFLRKKVSLILPGLIFFIITISPALAKTDTGISVFVPDRYMYLPLLGLLLIFIGLLQKFNRQISAVLLLMFFVFWSYKTFAYLPVWKNSYTLYDYSLKIDPNNMEALLNRSMCYLTDGEEDKAFIDLDLYIRKFPNSFNEIPYVNHGVILKNRGEFERALEDFNQALKIKPNSFQALLNRGTLYLAQNKLDEARIDFSAAYDNDSSSYILNKNISSLYNKSGNHAVALSFAEKCLSEKETDFDLLRIKGVSLFYLGKNKEAIEVFSNVLEKQKERGEMWYFRSMARFIVGDFNGANDDLKEALKLEAKIDIGFEKMLKDSLSVN
jgi:tetratricopeptide (TPR) repeat protein